MRIVFMGTPDFAVTSLEALLNSDHEVSAVFTQPDKPKGRKKELSAPPVKICAENNKIKIFQPEKLNNEIITNILNNIAPDLIVVVAYGKILNKNILNIPKIGCINLHGSLLPKYRGAAPIQWSIINGETKTGVTTMFMDEGLDTGDILFSKEIKIENHENSEDLYKKLASIGSKLLIYTIDKINNSDFKRIKQDNNNSSYCTVLNKSIGQINWEQSAKTIHNLVRGLNPWPVAFTKLNNKILKIYKSRIININNNIINGKLLSSSPLVISCGENTALEILELQLEGKKRMFAKEFSLGYKFEKNIILGI